MTTTPDTSEMTPLAGYYNDDTERRMFAEAEPGVRVVQRYRFGQQGVIVAVHKAWAWVMWDEYPTDHEPSTHHLTALGLAATPPERVPMIADDRLPRPPAGFQTCNVRDGRQDLWAAGATRQVNHLVAIPTSGPTLCGLTRFGEDADLPGWSLGGGVSGPTIEQIKCEACWTSATSTIPPEVSRGDA